MAQINTRIVLRNDYSFNWLLNENVVLLQGEFGVEFLPDNTCKVKIGDGTTQWKDLPYFGGEQLISDEKTILVNDKVLSLKGFAEAENGSQLRKNANGELEWFIPSTEAIDNLTSTVNGLNNQLGSVKEDLSKLEEIIFPTEDNPVSLPDRVNALEHQINGTGEGTVDELVNDKINDFATKISDDGTINSFKELIDYAATHGNEFAEVVADITDLQELVGETSVQNQIEQAINNSNHLDKNEANETFLSKQGAKDIYEYKRYEIDTLPEGAVVDYNDKEIRVFCPKNTQWVKQSVGANGNPNMYYMSFKAYAPEDAVSFKEGDRGVIVDQMHSFNEDFSGIDEYGRKYSICWLALANYNEDTEEWNYFGKNSTTKKYIGWTYVVEWYNSDGIIIGSDAIKINLSNENCHNIIEPYYMATVNVDKLVQDEGTVLVLYGGSATDNL